MSLFYSFSKFCLCIFVMSNNFDELHLCTVERMRGISKLHWASFWCAIVLLHLSYDERVCGNSVCNLIALCNNSSCLSVESSVESISIVILMHSLVGEYTDIASLYGASYNAFEKICMSLSNNFENLWKCISFGFRVNEIYVINDDLNSHNFVVTDEYRRYFARYCNSHTFSDNWKHFTLDNLETFPDRIVLSELAVDQLSDFINMFVSHNFNSVVFSLLSLSHFCLFRLICYFYVLYLFDFF